jgi:hypothetical protein
VSRNGERVLSLRAAKDLVDDSNIVPDTGWYVLDNPPCAARMHPVRRQVCRRHGLPCQSRESALKRFWVPPLPYGFTDPAIKQLMHQRQRNSLFR